MFKNTTLDDAIYQLDRIIRITMEGLALELPMDLFFEKMTTDVSFIESSLNTLFTKVQDLAHVPEYISIMQNLYSCERDYLLLLKTFMAKTMELHCDDPTFTQNISAYYKQHSDIKEKVAKLIKESDDNADTYQVVSKNELSQLLCV